MQKLSLSKVPWDLEHLFLCSQQGDLHTGMSKVVLLIKAKGG